MQKRVKSVPTCFAPKKKARRINALFIGSESNIGYGGIRDVTSIFKVLLIMQHNALQPHHVMYQTREQHRSKIFRPQGKKRQCITSESTLWKREGNITPRRALLSSFSSTRITRL